jgi:hypothetical protein
MKNKNEKQQNYLDWRELYEYVKREILGYKDEKLSQYFVLRLKGLAEGKFCSNKKTPSLGKYEYKTILYTFKICKAKIQEGLIGNNTRFKDERHKINFIMVIIENEINDVVDRINKANKVEEKIEVIDMSNQMNRQAEYKTKKKKVSKEIENLW